VQVRTYDHIPFDKVDEDFIASNLKKFSFDLKEFGQRKRCASCGMKNLNILKKPYREQNREYWRFMRVSEDDYSEVHLGVYTKSWSRVWKIASCIYQLWISRMG
jgi:hypothetical protein